MENLFCITCFNIVMCCCLLPLTSGNTNQTKGCEEIYLLETITDSFEASCSVLTIPCSGLYAVSSNCQKYIQCAHRRIFGCTCSAGTRYDQKAGTCIHDYEADCSCPPDNTTSPSSTSSSPDPSPQGQTAEEEGSMDTVIIAVVISLVALVAIIVLAVCFFIRRRKANEMEKLKAQFGDPYYISICETYASIDDIQVSDGIGPPVPNRDFSKTTEVIYDNKVTTETNEPSECPDTNEETSRSADAKEEKSTVVEGDTKSENCVENDTYSSVKRS